MPIDLKNYEPALMQGASITSDNDITVVDDLTVQDALAVTGTLTQTGAATFAGAIVSDATTDTTSGTTGAIQTDGGVGIAKALYVGTTATIIGATNFKRQVTDTGGAYATPVVLTSAQSGRVIIVDDAAGLDFTLPAIAAADIGTHFKFLITVTVTSNNFRVTAATGDLLFGGVWMPDFDAAFDSLTREGIWFTPNGSSHLVLTCNGSTTGGKVGGWVEYTATSATQWFVQGILPADGTIVTPFS